MTRKITVSLPDASLREYLQPHPDVTVLEWDFAGAPPRPRIDIVVPPYMGGPQVLQSLEAVDTALVQSQSIGYDGVADFLPSGRVFANAAGVHETSTAELALALILASQREFPRLIRNQQEGRWDARPTASLADRRVLIVGTWAGRVRRCGPGWAACSSGRSGSCWRANRRSTWCWAAERHAPEGRPAS